LENLEEMDKSLDAYDQPKLNEEAINYLSRSITSNEIERAIKSLPKKKSQGPKGFTTEFYQTFKELLPTLLKLFHEIEGKEHYYSNSMNPVLDSFQNQTRT
jgi:Rad3-related DNA helicase